MSEAADDFVYPAEMPKGAVLVAADEPLLVYPSTAAAELHLKAIDVCYGMYPAAYGPGGELYSVSTVDGQVDIEATGEPPRPDELRLLLLRYLEDRNLSANAAIPLEALVAQVWRIESEFWQENDPFGDRFGTRVPLLGCLAFALLLVMLAYLVFR